TRPSPRLGHMPGRVVQPLRSGGELSPSLRPRLFRQRAQDAVGRRPQLRRPEQRDGPRLRRPQRAVLARGVPFRRAAAGRRACHARRLSRPRARRAGPGGGRRPWPGPPRASRPRERPQRGATPDTDRPRQPPPLPRPVERLRPPRAPRPPPRRATWLLRGLPSPPAPPRPRPRRGLRLSGRVVLLPGARTGGAERRAADHELRGLPPEPRPDRQPGVRR